MAERHRACDTDKHRKLMKKQNAAHKTDKMSRQARRRAEELVNKQRRLLRRDRPDQSGFLEWAEKARFLAEPAAPPPEDKSTPARRIRDLLLQRIRTIESAAPEPGLVAVLRQWLNPGIFGITFPDIEPEPAAAATASMAVCPLCSIPITPEHYRYNVDWVKYNGVMLKVHKVCPNEPGYIFLREGSPGSGRFA